MKKERKPSEEKEPFKPQDTPKPPQTVEPHDRKQPDDKSHQHRAGGEASPRPHLLNEDADIDDETTI
jgi:hypothetical protein